MLVLLMRHADRMEGQDERNLSLTPRGLEQVASISQQLAKTLSGGPPIADVLTSPHAAPMETARGVMTALGIPGTPATAAALDPDQGNSRDPRGIAALVDTLPSASAILIVGHQPLLGELGRSWTGQRVSPVRGGVACIERHGSDARLCWILEPQLAPAPGNVSG